MSDTNRRRVLKGAATGAALSVAGEALAKSKKSKAWKVGVIGAGWFGKLNLNALSQVEPVDVVAMADVDQVMLEQARTLTLARPDNIRRQSSPIALYKDYREMLAKHSFDIVIIGTPDHWHVLPAIAALEAGAHVYLEKPVSVDVMEARALVAAAKKANKVVQVGTQRRTAPFVIEAKTRVLDAGLLGRIKHVEIASYHHQRKTSFQPVTAPPATLDWDAYCGPAPLIGYRSDIHPINWRSMAGFGNGYMGDMGVHFIDTARYVLGLGAPTKAFSMAGILVDKSSASDVPDTQVASFWFDDVLMTWTNRHWGRAPDTSLPWGAQIHGALGTLRLASDAYEYVPADPAKQGFGGKLDLEPGRYESDAKMPDWEKPLQVMTRWHMRDFVKAIKSGQKATADVEDSAVSTIACILANISAQLGRPVSWDAKAQTVINDPEAEKLLARAYRAPWRHPQAV